MNQKDNRQLLLNKILFVFIIAAVGLLIIKTVFHFSAESKSPLLSTSEISANPSTESPNLYLDTSETTEISSTEAVSTTKTTEESKETTKSETTKLETTSKPETSKPTEKTTEKLAETTKPATSEKPQVEEPEDQFEGKSYDVPLSNDLQQYIINLAAEKGVPVELIFAMIEAESNFNPKAVSATNDYGLMQINKGNHAAFSKIYGVTDFLDPYQNVKVGINLIGDYYRRYGDVTQALMCYNMGEGGANSAWRRGVYSTAYTRKIESLIPKYA